MNLQAVIQHEYIVQVSQLPVSLKTHFALNQSYNIRHHHLFRFHEFYSQGGAKKKLFYSVKRELFNLHFTCCYMNFNNLMRNCLSQCSSAKL